MRIIKSEINCKHKYGEFSPKLRIKGYTFCYFLTPFVYEKDGNLQEFKMNEVPEDTTYL